MITKVINVNLHQPIYERLTAKQGDIASRYLLFHLLDGDKPFDLTGKSVRVYARKPDKTEIFNDLTINDASKGYCTLELTSQCLAAAGVVKMELYISQSGKVLTSIPFELEVIACINTVNSVTSTNEFSALEVALSSLQDYDNLRMEIVQARKGYTTVGKRLDNFDSQLERNVRELPQVKKSVKLQHILLGMDSLTNGAGNTSYVDYFRDKIHGALGYGGAGYLPFEYQTLVNDSEYFSMNFVDDGTWVYLSGLTDLNNLSVINSFDNKGLYSENANGTTVRIECKTNCKYIKLIYLQQENGGSFTVQYNNGGKLQTVNTLGKTMVKTILIEENDNIKQGVFTITGAGKLTLYGMYCYNDEGAIVSKFGQGGQLLTKIIKNKEITDMWINILNPTFALLDCGTNDGGSNIYQNKYEILVQSLKDINCDITLIRPHNMAIEWTCEPYLFNVSKNKDIPILNIKNLFGNSFEEASNNGCMLDGIHPNDKGNIIKANKYLDYLSIPKISTLINKSYVSISDTEILYENVVKLTDKIVYTHSNETEGVELYNLGMIWSNGVKIPCAIIEIIANTTINYTSLKSKKVTFIMYNDSDTNKSKFERSSINNQILIDNDSYDFEFIIENLNNRTLIKLKSNSPYWINANITAKAYIVNNVNTTDIHVIEN